jgi:hypothetical protein
LSVETGQAHDLCLSVALVEGSPGTYYKRIERASRDAGYEEGVSSYQWVSQGRLRLLVEFFCPAVLGRPAGSLFKPDMASSPRAKRSMGRRLSALAIDAVNRTGKSGDSKSWSIESHDDANDESERPEPAKISG